LGPLIPAFDAHREPIVSLVIKPGPMSLYRKRVPKLVPHPRRGLPPSLATPPRISLFFFRISLFLLDKLPGMVLNTSLVEKHYVP
jgi:hypothetical protein